MDCLSWRVVLAKKRTAIRTGNQSHSIGPFMTASDNVLFNVLMLPVVVHTGEVGEVKYGHLNCIQFPQVKWQSGVQWQRWETCHLFTEPSSSAGGFKFLRVPGNSLTDPPNKRPVNQLQVSNPINPSAPDAAGDFLKADPLREWI